jgi:hypothetical protein
MSSLSDQVQPLLKTRDWPGILALLRRSTIRDRAQIRQALPGLIQPYLKRGTPELQSSPNVPVHQYLWEIAPSAPNHTKLTAIFAALSFACSTKRQSQSFFFGLLDPKNFLELLDAFQPKWLTDYFQHHFNANTIGEISYDFLLQLSERGYLTLAEEWIAVTLPHLIILEYISPGVRREKRVQFERLEDHPITLHTHIWLLFSYASNIHWLGSYSRSELESQKQVDIWYDCFSWLIEEQKIDRLRVLTQCLQAVTMPFNQSLLNWLIGLFAHLQPQEEELILLQTELFSLFHTPISKAVNISLGYLKKLSGHPDFAVVECMSQLGIPLLSETKSVVQSSLILLSKLAQKHPQHRHELALAACQALGQNDLPLQLRSAKLILAHGEKEDEELTTEIRLYAANLRYEVRTLLEEWIGEAVENPFIPSQDLGQLPPLPLDGDPLPLLHSYEDFIFLASQVFDKHEPWHFDHFLAGLLLFQQEIKSQNIRKLLPTFQRALQVVLNVNRDQNGLMVWLAKGLIIYGQQLMIWHSKEVEPLTRLYEEFARKDRQSAKEMPRWYQSRLPVSQDFSEEDGALFPFAQLIHQTLLQLKKGSQLPLLSTPTHAPHWVSPASLIERLSQYQLAKQLPNLLDFQLAIARIALDQSENKWKQALQKLSGEWQRILQFLLIEDGTAVGPFTDYELWVVAAGTRKQKTTFPEFSSFPFSAQRYLPEFLSCKWKTDVVHFKQKRYDYHQKKYINHLVAEPQLTVISNRLAEPSLSIWEKAQQLFLPKSTQESCLYSVFAFWEFRKQTHQLFVSIPHLFSLTPNTPEPAIALIIERLLKINTASYSDVIIEVMEILLVSREPFGMMVHLLIAASLVNQDKTVRVVAAELWIAGIARGQVDGQQLGQMLGKLEAIEYAPLKRLIDLILSQWLNLSIEHNQALEYLLAACLVELPPEPIRNLRKLVGIYLEIRQTNQSKELNPRLLEQLKIWETTAALSKFPQLYLDQSI